MTRLRDPSVCAISAALVLMLASEHASAESSSAQRATAEALFQQANQLMADQHVAEACEKFAASQELDPALGTMLYLADCYERAGRSASAWALFREAADTAQRAGQADREQIATERATRLEGKLSKLELSLPAAQRSKGLQLFLNDVPVPGASWNAPLPVDPGATHIEARAPGKKTWQFQLKIVEGPSNQVVRVPPLVDAPRARTDAGAVTFGTDSPRGSGHRTAGYLLSATGVVALAVGGFLGYRAYSLNKHSKSQCRAGEPNSCTPDGVHTRDDARTAAALSTIVSAAGGLLTVSGITLLITAPSSTPPPAGSKGSAQALVPALGLQLEKVW